MKRILSIVLTLALLLTALPLALSVSAAETEIVFTMGADGSASHSDGTSNKTSYTETNGDYTLSITDGVKLATGCRDAKGNGCIRIGTGSAIGSFKFEVPRDVTSVVIAFAQYKANAAQVKVNGNTQNITTASNNGAYTDITVDTSSTKTVNVETTSSGKRVMINTITFYKASSGSEPETPVCEHTNKKPVKKDDDAENHDIKCDDCGVVVGTAKHDFTNGDCVCGQEAPYVPDIEGSSLTFELAADGEAKHSDGGNDINGSQDFKDTTGTYTLTINDATKVYPNARDEKGNGCLKLGGSSSAASLSFTVPDNVVKVIFSVAQYKANTTKISINGGAAQSITTASNNGAYTPVEFDTTTTKSITLSTVSGGYRAMLNSITFLTANAEEECTHENTTTTNTATCFKDGMVTVICDDCGETVSETKADATNIALTSREEKFENGNLTITLTYSEDLIKDIQNGAVISFNYSIGEYSNSIEIPTGIAAEITLEGFNTDRLNAQLTYYLTAEYTGVNTDKLAGDTTNSLKVSEKIDANSEIGVLMNALKTEANTVVSTKIDATTHFAENTITADLKEGTMVLNFIASDELVAMLTENKAYTRTNKITVTIDGVANKYEFTPEVMRKSTTINISGMSFAQLNGTVTVKVEFIYNNASVEDITDTITFVGAKAVAETDTPVANAFAEYIAK